MTGLLSLSSLFFIMRDLSAAIGNFGKEESLFKGSLARRFHVFGDQRKRVVGRARATHKKLKKFS
ncbi:hypothetical protein [Sphingopyxis fribergensis]